MPVNYARAAQRAAALIKANGIPLVLSRPAVVDDYDPALGSADQFGTEAHSGSAVRTEYEVTELDDGQGSRTRIATCTLLATFDDGDIKPQSGEPLTINGESGWVVDTSKPLQPGATLILYEIAAKTV